MEQVQAEWTRADLSGHPRSEDAGIPKRIRPGRLRVDPYMAPQWRVMEPGWVNEVGEIETWLAMVPIVLFMYVRFHHVNRVKRLFGSEQAVPLDPVNLDGFLGASARGDDKWWPHELAY
ncbi:hypothetical protein PIB30_074710 [Stylosanthes scabra]|uniref:Uncharacterized protein n=1 Tax=Stylosanthes scabra TaxID=79078 RepID=A0ABU6ZNP9_9FABA|nr:hypothetical protein [Stylosanthes scabra]